MAEVGIVNVELETRKAPPQRAVPPHTTTSFVLRAHTGMHIEDKKITNNYKPKEIFRKISTGFYYTWQAIYKVCTKEK